ncbi:MAG: gamma carbonic anhydrase family protein [Candidatus Nezhaarchaeales archaeon]
MNAFALKGKAPSFGVGVFVDPTARIIGDVEVGDYAAVWYGSIVKGEDGLTRIGARSVIMEQCLVENSQLGEKVLVSHRAVLHRCVVERGVLIGIGAIVLDGARIGEESIVGAGSLIMGGFRAPRGSLIVGSPARVLREVTDKDRAFLEKAFNEASLKSRLYAEVIGTATFRGYSKSAAD